MEVLATISILCLMHETLYTLDAPKLLISFPLEVQAHFQYLHNVVLTLSIMYLHSIQLAFFSVSLFHYIRNFV
jgi:hypothetical protein